MTELLRTKLGLRPPRPGLVERRALLARLALVRGARLVLVSAPAGFGKSTLLSQWSAARGLDTAWLTLDAADNTPTRFLRYVLAAVAPLAGDDRQRLEALAASPRLAPDAVLPALVDALSPLPAAPAQSAPAERLLVLDDYHLVETPVVHEAVAALIDAIPPGAHVAIATRVDPPLPLARLRARAELFEVRAEHLRFSVAEAGSFLQGTMGLALSDAEVASLTERTEGWAAGLQLAGLSLQGRGNAGAFIAAFTGSHRFVLDYLLEEVLGGQPAHVQQFLVQTSILDRLTADLCDAVTGERGTQSILEYLERANLFLVPLDDERRWYRYHHLFADLLRAQLRQRLAGVVASQAARESEAALHRRAAAWLDEHGFPGAAIRHALAAGDIPGAVALVERHWLPTEFVAGDLETALRWLDALPDAVVRANPVLGAAYAWALTLGGIEEGAEARLADAEAALRTPPPGAESSEGAAMRGSVPALVALVRSILARISGDSRRARACAQQALALVPSGLPRQLEAVLRGGAWSLTAQAHDAAGEHAAAGRAYREALPLLREGAAAVGVCDTVYHLACHEVRAGRPAAALALCQEGLRDAAGAGLAEAPSSARLHLGLAESLLAAGDRQGARDHATRGLALARLGAYGPAARLAQELLDRIDAAPAPGVAAAGRHATTPGLVEPLTTREREVLSLLAAGHSNRRIAEALVVTVGTVKYHVHSICGKLASESRLHAVARARQLGLVA